MLVHQILGRNLRSLRLERNLTQIRLGMCSGIALTYITSIERGKVPGVKLYTIAALAGALRVAPSDLLRADLPQYKGRWRAGRDKRTWLKDNA